MRLVIDTESNTLEVEEAGKTTTHPLYSRAAFALLAAQYVKMGWNQKASYAFSWLGRPIIQLPEDLMRIQEVIHQLRPDVVIETGVAHGGSLIFYASLFEAMGKGRVVGIDIEIRAHNRAAIEAHPLAKRITLLEGSSTDPGVVERVRGLVQPRDRVLVILDSNHSYDHVAAELEAYHGLVSPGSYIVATDGIMQDLHDVPRGQPGWDRDNPAAAARDFAARHPEFVLDPPPRGFDESEVDALPTYWPDAWLRRA